ncbi:signal peptidase II [Arsenicicoccus sp. oral taxon 190]|uniref:signal peptidase II n=1 Tax=Arsenicicoccus sp. oral taxon 190 TaxID=1658671 RepID=UPI0020A1DAE9|nr:signal peptidase II [Arsenicicoccus sp. oral taxon 190]
MTATRQPRRHTWPLLAVIAAAAFVADQVSKAWALRDLTPGMPRPLLGSVFQLNLIHNSGAAFSIGSGQTWLLTLVAVGIGGAVLWHARRIVSVAWAVAGGLVMGGLLGNLYDRLFRPPSFGQGHVVDFLDYNGWFIGNVADIAIVAAAILVGLLAILGVTYDGSGPADRPATREEVHDA